MKKISYLSVILIGIMVIGCAKVREKTAEELLEDPKMENEIYASILSDKNHLSIFMDKMMADENCKAMMMRNTSMVKMICMSENIDSLINADNEVMENISGKLFRRMEMDSSVCDRTCTRMMESDKLRKYILKHSSKKMEEKAVLKPKNN